MNHFIYRIKKEKGVLPIEKHLLIFIGHKFHISLEVLMKAKESSIDIVFFSSHISHKLQLIDKACFKSFKVAFRAYRNL